MDLILRHARIPEVSGTRPVDLGIDGGRIIAMAPHLAAAGREIDVQGCLVAPGFIETHIHLDKSCILDRCKAEQGDLEEAIGEVARAKTAFTPRTSTGAVSGPSSNASCTAPRTCARSSRWTRASGCGASRGFAR